MPSKSQKSFPPSWGYWIILVCISIGKTQSECFTGVFRAKCAAAEETQYLNLGRIALNKLKNDGVHHSELMQFESFITNTLAENQPSVEYADYMENPINIFHMVRRLVNDWQNHLALFEGFSSPAIKDFVQILHNGISRSKVWPSQEDITGTALALIRLRNTYFISQFDMWNGYMNGSHSKPLAIGEFYEIARIAENRRMYFEAVEWYGFVLDLLQRGAIFEKSVADIMIRQAQCYDSHGDPAHALGIIEDAILTDTHGNVELQQLMDYYNFSVTNSAKPPAGVLGRTDILQLTHEYEALCRNDHIRDPMLLAKLKCYWHTTTIPYRPADVEVVNLDPWIAIFHRVIYESEIEVIKEKAKEVLTRSSVITSDGQGNEFSDERISQSGWLEDTASPTIEQVNRRVEMFTGLSTRVLDRISHAETLQVLNYGIGGMYNYHYDFFDESKHKWRLSSNMEGSGNRIATWMTYLSDVQAGGATVFPRVGARIPVVKGAAAFWYNLKRSGAYDYDTLHAGCPVLIGSKWVSNKWCHEVGQEFRRRCAKDPTL